MLWDLSYLDGAEIKSYMFKTTGYSPIDKKMNGYWNWVLQHLPLSWSPAHISLIGLSFVMAAFTMLVSTNVAMDEISSPAMFYCFALAIFLAQTADAVDGKQRRSLGASVAFASFFDHAVDSITGSLVMVYFAAGLGLGISNISILLFGVYFVMFFTS